MELDQKSPAFRGIVPRVTIGLPFYNSAATLVDTLRSVFRQTFQNWELILVDDGSTDDSVAIATAVGDKRVRVLADGTNRGISWRLNQIAHLARGSYLARMDSDDLMHPNRIERQARFLDERPQCDIVGSGIYTIDASNRPMGVRGCQALELTPGSVMTRALYEHPTVMARVEWFRKNPYDVSYDRAEDYELWCRTFVERTTQFGKLEEPLLFFRELGSVRLDKCLRSYRALEKIFRRYGPDLIGPNNTRRQIAKLHAKAVAWRLATIARAQRTIIARRNQPLDFLQQQSCRTILADILSTSVPGLSAGKHAA